MRVLLLSALVLVSGCASTPDEIVRPATYAKPPQYSYPRLAQRLGQEGVVLLRVQVFADGKVGEIQLKKGSGHALLDSAAIESTGRAEFTPAETKSGRLVDSWMDAPVRYLLK